MGSVLLYFDESTKVNQVLALMQAKPLAYDFRVIAVNATEA